MNLTTIIATKDRNQNIKFCIKSIASCNPRPNVILVDFGSTPKISNDVGSYPWLQIIRVEKNTKLFHKSRAINIGIKHAKTKYICLTDADQVFNPNFFSIVYRTVRIPKTLVMCSTFFLDRFPGNTSIDQYSNTTYSILLNKAKKSKKLPQAEGCCHAIPREEMIKIGGYDERYVGWGFEDKDMVYRLHLRGYSIVNIKSLTNMVHLPHGRNKEYFNKEFRIKNENLYYKKKKSNKRHFIIANKGKDWGCIC